MALTMLAQVGRPWLAAVRASDLLRDCAEGSDGAAQAQRVLHVCRAADLGEGERVPLPVGHADEWVRR
jgi:hypothetical protein